MISTENITLSANLLTASFMKTKIRLPKGLTKSVGIFRYVSQCQWSLKNWLKSEKTQLRITQVSKKKKNLFGFTLEYLTIY